MIKNIAIALLLGIIVGGAVKAEGSSSITRKDLFEAAALHAILSNTSHDPFGPFNFQFWRGPEQFTNVAKEYAKRAAQ